MQTKEDCLASMMRMEIIESTEGMSPMLWDEVGWMMHYLVGVYKCDEKDLKKQFPHLLDFQ